jgi:tetratricopeptide (TPR) repeat protein
VRFIYTNAYCVRFRKFEKANNYLRIYNSLYSDSIDLLYIESIVNKKLDNFLDAKISAEKIFLRNPEHKKNLFNLLHIYNELGDFENKIMVQKKLDTYKNEIY